MSKSKIVQTVCCSLSAVVLMIVAVANFARLQSRADAPGVVDYLTYVGSPGILSLVVSAGTVVLVVVACVTTRNGDSSPPPGPSSDGTGPVIPPTPKPSSGEASQEDVEAKRSRIWRIIDELSDALRDDDAGSEALFVVRERFHKLQFAPKAHSDDDQAETDQPTAPAKKQPV